MDRAVRPGVLEGRYVRLEPLTPEHANALAAAAAGSRESYGWTYVPEGVPQAIGYIDAALADQEAGRALPFATVLKETEAVVGTTRFGNIEYWAWPEGNALQRGAELPDAVEIGWTWLAASAQRTPVNSEAKLLMMRHAFEVWHVRRVRLMTDRRNERSRAAIERIGGQLDGILRAHTVASDGTVRDSAVYSIVEAEWPVVAAKLEASRLTEPGTGGPRAPVEATGSVLDVGEPRVWQGGDGIAEPTSRLGRNRWHERPEVREVTLAGVAREPGVGSCLEERQDRWRRGGDPERRSVYGV
jgi:RimJ/RimL family protein N-acetyltransferase